MITEFSTTGGGRAFHLRNDALIEAGFNVAMDATGSGVRVTRLGADDGPNGEIEVPASHAAKLLELGAKIEASLAGLHGTALHSATAGEQPFRELPAFQAFVEKLISRLAPTTRVIAERSLLPTELVIRKLLSNDRREELFVAKAMLREKFAPLPESRRALFTPLAAR